MMDAEAFRLMASHEDRHWWFVGRRSVIRALLARIPASHGAAILEAGCGTGGNLFLLAEHGDVSAFEPSPEARAIAMSKDPTRIIVDGELPSRLPYPDASFDLVVAADVLEHVERDAEALAALVTLARPGGWILVTVPAHAWLWGSHDRRLHHVRRYGRARLTAICRQSGADLVRLTAFNTLLAPIAIVLRLAERITDADLGNQERMPPRIINSVLGRIFALEGPIIRRLNLPAGMSYGAVLRRPPPPSAPATQRSA